MIFFKYFNLLRFIRRQERGKVSSLLKLFRKLDCDIRKFQRASGLKCREGCGQCCENPRVETTAAEFLPLAFHLWREKKAEGWLLKAQEQNFTGRCVFYEPRADHSGRGRCSVYALRPLICRLFGFSAVTDKNNRKMLLTCPIIKTEFSSALPGIEKAINEKMFIPKTTDYVLQAQQIDPSLSRQLPINEALKLSLEKVGLILKYRC